jgi:predicted nucleotidyltransferase
MINPSIAIPYDEIAAFCERHHIRKLSLFGSVLRDDFRPDSDIDVLVEYELGHSVTYLDMGHMESELTRMFGQQVDLREPEELSPLFRSRVVDAALRLYERT